MQWAPNRQIDLQKKILLLTEKIENFSVNYLYSDCLRVAMGIKDKCKAAACATAARLLAMKAQVENRVLNDVEILENKRKL